MDRRDFFKYAAVSTAGLSVTNLYGYDAITGQKKKNLSLVASRSCELPVIANVDVLVIGGSAAGVAAATAASGEGASVFLVAAEPYLGYDVCGTLRFDEIAKGATTNFSQSLLSKSDMPTPADVKSALQNHLVDSRIDFLMSSYAGGVIFDDEEDVAGMVITNRSGEQIIRARSVIDATDTALVAGMIGTGMKPGTGQPSGYRFRVVGNRVNPDMKHKQLRPLVFKNKEYPVTEYRFSGNNEINKFDSHQALEQSVRDKTWDPDQVDASDMLFEIPASNIKSAGGSGISFKDPESFPLSQLQLKKSKRLFVLNGYADVSFSSKETMLLPGNMMALGLKLGSHVGSCRKQLPLMAMSHVGDRQGKLGGSEAKVTTYNRPPRPAHEMGSFQVNSETIPVIGDFDNVIVGGGTAGACAAISSSRYGSKTVVIESLHGLGGMGTMGLIGRYWVGYREGFTSEIDEGVRNMAPADHPRQKKRSSDWVKDWKMEWYRREIQKAGGKIWFGALACGAVVDGNTVKGVIISTPYGKRAVMAQNVIDSTGSADIAIAAGARFEFVHADSVAVQGAGLPKVDPDDHYNNTDYTFIDDTDVFDSTRVFISGNAKFKNVYDIGKLPQTRERRRMVGDYTLSALDMANGRQYDDTISYHYSSFDTHGFTIDPYFIIKPPADSSVDMHVNVPLRALLPKGLNNIIVTGLGASADRDAMPILRMQPCLQNQGYAVGYAASLAQKGTDSFRNLDLEKVRSELLRKGTLPQQNRHEKDNYPPSDTQIRKAIRWLVNDYEKLEMVLWDQERGLKLLKEAYDDTNDPQLKIKCGSILGFYGYQDVCDTLVQAIAEYEDWDEGWNFKGLGQFGRSASYLDALLMSLGNTGNPDGFAEVERLAGKLTVESELSHFRAVSEAFAGLKRSEAVPVLHRLLTMPGAKGYTVDRFSEVVSYVKEEVNDNTTRNKSLRELFLARALFICGDRNELGYNILTRYVNDLRGPYSAHAMDVLKKYT